MAGRSAEAAEKHQIRRSYGHPAKGWSAARKWSVPVRVSRVRVAGPSQKRAYNVVCADRSHPPPRAKSPSVSQYGVPAGIVATDGACPWCIISAKARKAVPGASAGAAGTCPGAAANNGARAFVASMPSGAIPTTRSAASPASGARQSARPSIIIEAGPAYPATTSKCASASTANSARKPGVPSGVWAGGLHSH